MSKETFKNLKITIHLKKSVAMQKNKAAFDAILALLYFNKLKYEKKFNGDYSQNLPFLEKSNGVYHTSFPIFNGISYYDKEALIKTFDHEIYAKYGQIVSNKGKAKGRISTVQGAYKNAFFSIERIGAESIVYYVRGGKDIIAQLLKNLRFIGKKSSLGWGEIDRIEIEEVKRDYSLVCNRKLMRNIPTENNLGISSEKVALFRLEHPYWKKTGLVECYMP